MGSGDVVFFAVIFELYFNHRPKKTIPNSSRAGGTIFRIKGSILSLSFLDCNGFLIPYSYETWRDDNRPGGGGGGSGKCFWDAERQQHTANSNALNNGVNRELTTGTPTKNTHRMSPTMQAAGGSGATGSESQFADRQFIVITSEKHARVVALPSQNCVYRQTIAESDYAVKAEVISLKGKGSDRVLYKALVDARGERIKFELNALHERCIKVLRTKTPKNARKLEKEGRIRINQ